MVARVVAAHAKAGEYKHPGPVTSQRTNSLLTTLAAIAANPPAARIADRELWLLLAACEAALADAVRRAVAARAWRLAIRPDARRRLLPNMVVGWWVGLRNGLAKGGKAEREQSQKWRAVRRGGDVGKAKSQKIRTSFFRKRFFGAVGSSLQYRDVRW